MTLEETLRAQRNAAMDDGARLVVALAASQKRIAELENELASLKVAQSEMPRES